MQANFNPDYCSGIIYKQKNIETDKKINSSNKTNKPLLSGSDKKDYNTFKETSNININLNLKSI